MHAETCIKAVQDITDNHTCWAGNHANSRWHFRNRTLAVCIKKPFGRQHTAAFFKHFQNRPFASYLHLVDDNLIFRLTGIGCQLARTDNFQPLFGLHLQIASHRFPAYGGKGRAIIFQREIDMARWRPRWPRNFRPHPHIVKSPFNGRLDTFGQFTNRHIGCVIAC